MSTEDRLVLSVRAHSETVLVEPCYRRGFPQTTELAQPFGSHRDASQRAKRNSRLFGVWTISQALQLLRRNSTGDESNSRTTRPTRPKEGKPSGSKRGNFRKMLRLLGSFLWLRVRTITNAFGGLSHNCSPARQGCGVAQQPCPPSTSRTQGS